MSVPARASPRKTINVKAWTCDLYCNVYISFFFNGLWCCPLSSAQQPSSHEQHSQSAYHSKIVNPTYWRHAPYGIWTHDGHVCKVKFIPYKKEDIVWDLSYNKTIYFILHHFNCSNMICAFWKSYPYMYFMTKIHISSDQITQISKILTWIWFISVKFYRLYCPIALGRKAKVIRTVVLRSYCDF